jgi:hypothetical protein
LQGCRSLTLVEQSRAGHSSQLARSTWRNPRISFLLQHITDISLESCRDISRETLIVYGASTQAGFLEIVPPVMVAFASELWSPAIDDRSGEIECSISRE